MIRIVNKGQTCNCSPIGVNLSDYLRPREPTEKEINDAIEKVANIVVRKYKLPEVALFYLRSLTPMLGIYGQSAFFMLFPYIPILGDELGDTAVKYAQIFQSRENFQKLIDRIEQMVEEDREYILPAQKTEKEPKGVKSWFKKRLHK